MSESTALQNGELSDGISANDIPPVVNSSDETQAEAIMKSPAAPVLRVEQLKEEEGCSSGVQSEEEGLSIGENSDAEGPSLGEFVAPNDEIRDKVINQVEFYFSDANILKDAFLLKHVKRNKQGYVSLKLITSFKKMKSLTKDYRVVAYSLRQSEKLLVNEEGTKVKRKDPLPDYDETTPSKTVVAINLPMENPSIGNISQLFSKCGDIALIRILKPGKTVPQDVKKHTSKHPEIGTSTCAVVEFEKHEFAKKACDTMNSTDNWRSGLRVVLLADQRKNKDKERKDKENEMKNDFKSDGEKGSDVEVEDKKRKKRRNQKKRNSRVEELTGDGDADTPNSSGSEADGPTSRNRSNSWGKGDCPRNRSQSWGNKPQKTPSRNSLSPTPGYGSYLSPNASPRSSPKSSPKTSPTMQRRRLSVPKKSPLAGGRGDEESPKGSPDPTRKGYSSGEEGSPGSPWVARRLKAAQEVSPLVKDLSPNASPMLGRRQIQGRMSDMGGVIRQPKGPDGTLGFKGRGKPISPLAE
ncbi:unnamed protein product [Owenia fusiformis]|uniref:Uncharacterized protein n=1 Tax=Owenia fusiformis TaxID=6347 RepID=A0A8J1TVM4_OWEFU|nr:unnamed protein product [Owenia fusiformis]